MKVSLKTKVSTFVALIIIVISFISTYFFIYGHSRSIERELIARGTALSYSLAKAAEEGLAAEDLDLIKRAAHIVQAEDVVLVQVYSTIWEAIDAYPFERLKEPPDSDALNHFKISDTPIYKKIDSKYDFYGPILFRPSENSPTISIGFVRLTLSSSAMQKELREIIISNIGMSATITLLVIIAINMLISRLVIKPVMSLHKSVSMFKGGALPNTVPVYSDDEIGELSTEFNNMSNAIKEKTDRLVDSEKRIKSLFERVEHAIFRLDKDGNIIEANNRFYEMFGTVKSLCILLMSEEKGSDCLLKALSEKAVQIEEKVMGKYGNELFVLLSIYPETDNGGNIKGYDGYIVDITEKKKLEESLLRSQKMEAIGTLAGGIAHDFNNMLAAVLGYSEMMLSEIKEGDRFYKPVTIIKGAAESGAELAKKILTVARKERLEPKPLSLNNLIIETKELLLRSIPKNIEIDLSLAENLPLINADLAQIQQVILNLAVNARDAMPEGGVLTIKTSLVGRENGVANGITISGTYGYVRLSVSDTGKGMDTETRRRIFDPFFTTKKGGRGTGLGLYIVHSIVSNHRGYINVYSEPDKGTLFNLYFPAIKGGRIEETTLVEDVRGRGTVLVIDDEEYIRELTADMLGSLGYRVLLADSGARGISLFKQNRDGIDVIVLDMIMPKMGGGEVFQVLKTLAPDVKVVICSGYSHEGFAAIDELLKAGAKGFVQKPFTKQTLGIAIKRAL